MRRVMLRESDGATHARLREITGLEERAVEDCATGTALCLLDQLLQPQVTHDLASGKAADLTAYDRDLLLGAVYQQIYGQRVESQLRCSNCGTAFELTFVVNEAFDSKGPDETVIEKWERDNTDTFWLGTDGRFRLPNGWDELAIQDLTSVEARNALLSRCVIEGDPIVLGEQVLAALEALAPNSGVEIGANCPECHQIQSAYFDLQSYLLTALAQERPRLLREIHLLATAYGWGLDEILGLPRSQRRAFVELIVSGVGGHKEAWG